MKKLLTILISASLALAAGAMAQQEDASPSPKKKKQVEGEHRPGPGAQRPANEARPAREARPANEARPMQNRKAARKEHAEANAPAETKATSEPSTPAPAAMRAHGKNANANNRQRGEQMKKEHNAPNEATTANKPVNANAPTPAPAEAQANTANPPANKGNARAKKPDPQVVQKVKTEHANFKAQPKPEKVPPVTFNQSYRISGAEQWQGPQYEVFRSYRPERHDQGWYRSHFTRVEIIAGGAYYFNNGYWYPAWGYNPSFQYYAYDAPIYVGSRAEPPDRVIAEVQAILQQEGYYKGEVDGLLGPLTREALVGYQTDNGLYATATIDEPTLASLDLG
jgi:hypothetical protein